MAIKRRPAHLQHLHDQHKVRGGAKTAQADLRGPKA